MNEASKTGQTDAGATTSAGLPGHLTPFIRGMALVARIGLRVTTRVRIEGDLDAIPRSGPLIIAANHLSNADGIMVGGWLTPALGRRKAVVGLGTRRQHVAAAGADRGAGSVHPVDRDTADIEAFRLAQRILDEGHVLVVFPEGTRSPTGALQLARDGLALLALRSDAVILPVGVSGTERYWPRGKLPRVGRGRISMRIGRPFRLSEILPPGTNRKQAKPLATTAIMARIAALLPERNRGAYADAAKAIDAG